MPREKSVHYETIKQMLLDGYLLRDIYQKLKDKLSRQRVTQLKDQIVKDYPEIAVIYEESQIKAKAEKKNLIQKCADLASSNHTVPQIAEILGINSWLVYYYLGKTDVKPNGKRSSPPIIRSGSIYGNWLVGEVVDKRDSRDSFVRHYRCVCTLCSDEYLVRQAHLLQGRSKSCVKCSPKLRKRPKL